MVLYNPFPPTANLQQTTLKHVYSKIWINLYYCRHNYWYKRWKHCGKKRNCSFWVISPFCHDVFKSCLLQMRRLEWVKPFHIRQICGRQLRKHPRKSIEKKQQLWMIIYVLGSVRHIVAIGEICHGEHVFRLSQCFQTTSAGAHQEAKTYVEKG